MSEFTKNVIFYTLAAVVCAFLVLKQAKAQETTFRVGDIIPYTAGCWEKQDAMDLMLSASRLDSEKLFSQKLTERKCFILTDARGHLASLLVELKEFVYGPVKVDGRITASLWRGVDIQGTEVWIALLDHTGRHPMNRAL